MKSSRHAKLAFSDRARNDLGNPPRSHKRTRSRGGTSSRTNPPISTKEMRPASDSELCCRSSGDALPRMRNFAGAGLRSSSTRRMGKRSGRGLIPIRPESLLRHRQAKKSVRKRLCGFPAKTWSATEHKGHYRTLSRGSFPASRRRGSPLPALRSGLRRGSRNASARMLRHDDRLVNSNVPRARIRIKKLGRSISTSARAKVESRCA